VTDVVVSGVGIIAPTGVGRDAFWDAVRAGRSVLGPLTRLDASAFPCRVAGQVPDAGWDDGLDARGRRTAPFASRLLLAAAHLALADAGIAPTFVAPERRGAFVGTALGGWRTGEEQLGVVRTRGARRVNPFLANAAPPYAPGAMLATAIGAQGPQLSFTSGCPASLQAVGYAAAAVAEGEDDRALAGGVELPLCELVVAGMGRTGELYAGDAEPAAASRPFDVAHGGMVLSEAAGVLVLEPLAQVVARGGRPLARMLGHGDSCDAQGLYGAAPDGVAGARAVHAALRRAGRAPGDVGWVCAHANAARAFDHKEAAVLRAAFGEASAQLPVSSIKGVVGHPLGASGALQTIAAALALADGVLPPTANLERPAPECTLAHIVGGPQPWRPTTALVTSYGYGGVNAALLLGAA
jgi:3-oxoacyl-[acyl-carrier-protein] synthase II